MGAPSTAPQLAEALFLDTSRRRKLLGYALSRFGIGAADAEDLFQDTLVEILRGRARVLSPEGYLFAIFRLCCTRFVAARSLQEAFLEAARGSEADLSAPERIHSRVALRQALGGISSSCRRILCAVYIEGRSLREMADDMDVTASGASKTMNRCLRRLQARLDEGPQKVFHRLSPNSSFSPLHR